SGKDMIFSAKYSWKEYIPVFLPSNAKYSVKGDFLFGVTEKTKVSTLISSFKFNNISVVNQNNKKVSSSAYVGTGYKIRLMKNGKIIDSHIIVISGDVDGNCVVNSSDYLKIKTELIGKYNSKDAYILAADIDQNKKIDNEDCLKLKKDFLSD
ncbi:MAG: dockerin type I repeat-containing protein, partial [Clostridia bacterium]|nr:dockerin type I repeat-containing protein [Clostridia bacterium]